MSHGTLIDHVWETHRVTRSSQGQDQVFVDLDIHHEVTSLPAFKDLEARGLPVRHPECHVATVDHIVPTDDTGRQRPFKDRIADTMVEELGAFCEAHGIRFFGLGDPRQGIVHVIGPELGLTQPGMLVVCGDSHTSTHGALGCVAFGVGTSQIRDVLAAQSLYQSKPKVCRIWVDGVLPSGVYPKDVILYIIGTLGTNGGTGYAYEYAGPVFDAMSIEGRMTVCNMSIEAGAKCGYVNPDQRTVEYLRGREFVPQDPAAFDQLATWWLSMGSRSDATYDAEVVIDANEIQPQVTWGINPGQVAGVKGRIPEDADATALQHMQFTPGQPIEGTPVHATFIGSCTNARIEDLREAAAVVRTLSARVADGTRAFVVPGSEQVRAQAEAEGLHRIFTEAGFDWRGAGCSMCLGMNPDKLQGDEICASTSNRNFRGRQGSPDGRTLLMSPAMAVAAALYGKVVDVREALAPKVAVHS